MVHLEGMGVLGSILAWRLYNAGVPFTWHDTDAPIAAWRASTAAIYPSGDAFDQQNYVRWGQWHHNPPWPAEWQLTEAASYWYSAKSAPHGGSIKPLLDIGPLRLHPQPSYHLNAQTLVTWTQARFGSCRLPPDQAPSPAAGPYLVTHGYSAERLHHYLWGWSVPITVQYDDRLRWANQRPCLYLRTQRYVFAYAYPRPGTSEWYAGSALIVQKHAKPLAVLPKFGAWKRLLDEQTQGLVQVVTEGEPLQGWRPCPAQDDQEGPLVRRCGDRLVARPLWHSGVRWSPLATDAMLAALGVGQANGAGAPPGMLPSVAEDCASVREAHPDDKAWVKRIWHAKNERLLGPCNTIWYRYWLQEDHTRERWLVVPDKGFAHYRIGRDGSITLYEIAVADHAKRMGVGRMLLSALSEHGARTVRLKTDAAHAESNAFYLACGFCLIGSHTSRSGEKVLNEYAR